MAYIWRIVTAARALVWTLNFDPVFSERELARPICHRTSVCLSSVTFVHPTQTIEIFGNVFTPFGTLAIH